MITIYNFQAGYGDTFLIQVEIAEIEPVNILVDCGFEFKKNVLPKLAEIAAAGGRLNRMIITHFDDDHISSALQFLKDYHTAEKPIIPIDQIWLNTFRHLPFPEDTITEPSKADVIRTSAYVSEYISRTKPFEEKDMGATQAVNLGAEILKTGIAWNTDFHEKAACVEHSKEIWISNDVQLSLLTPNYSLLEKLKSKFIGDLRKMNITASKNTFFDDAFEVYSRWVESQEIVEKNISKTNTKVTIDKLKQLKSEYDYLADDAVGNGSSITFILKAEGKKLLFLADAHAEDLITEIKLNFPDCIAKPTLFDAIKVPHHGSFRNNKPELYEIIDSYIYIFSTNGKHQSHVHPDVETIAQIINRPLPKDIAYRKLYFNHCLEHLEFLNEIEFQEEFKFKVFYDEFFTV